MDIIVGIVFTVVGIVLASFSNVLIYRLPRQESIVSPGSHCPACGHPLSWYENIPIFSYLFLGGRCRNCRGRISPRYLAVEVAGGVLALLAYLRFGLSVDGVIGALTLIVLLAVALIDAEHMEIPLALNITLGLLAVAKLVLNVILDRSYGWSHYLIGGAGAAGLFLLVYWLGRLIYKREAMGLGDVILMSVAGLYLGWPGAFVVVLISSVVCSVTLLLLLAFKKIHKDQEMPFGPYLAGGFAVILFVAPNLLTLILDLF